MNFPIMPENPTPADASAWNNAYLAWLADQTKIKPTYRKRPFFPGIRGSVEPSVDEIQHKSMYDSEQRMLRAEL